MSYALLQERHERTDTPGDEVRWSQDDVVSSFGSGQTPVREIKAELPTSTKTTTLGILRGAFDSLLARLLQIYTRNNYSDR